MASAIPQPSFLATRRGKLTLALLAAVAFLDFVDASIVNVALPSIRRDLGFSEQGLQWVPSAYLLTYGGFMLLGGRAADLLGRRRVLVAGTVLIGVSSLIGGFADSEGVLIGARLAQGLGAAMMLPAALSILTTSLQGGLGSQQGARSLGRGGRARLRRRRAPRRLADRRARLALGDVRQSDRRGARPRRDLLADRRRPAPRAAGGLRPPRSHLGHRRGAPARLHAGEAPDSGLGNGRTIGELIGAVALLAAFVINERRNKNPLLPLSIFRIRGLAAADATQLIAFAGFLAMFFFLTLYMQNVLGYSPIQTGAAYLPLTFGVAVAAGVSSQLLARTGTRPVIVAGALIAAGGVYWLSRIPVGGSYLSDLLPGMMVMSLGLGAVFVAVTTAANAGVPADKAGLAAALLNASQQVGGALGLAIFSAIATSRTGDLLASHVSPAEALTSGFQRALLASSLFLVAAAFVALRITNTRGEQNRPDAEAEREIERTPAASKGERRSGTVPGPSKRSRRHPTPVKDAGAVPARGR